MWYNKYIGIKGGSIIMVTLKDLKLQEETNISIININDIEVEVKQYIGIQDKMSIINIAMQESLDSNGLVVKPIAESLVLLYTVYLYSNITFTPDEKDSPVDTYNLLEKTGVIDKIISAIPEVEFQSLMDYFEECVKDSMTLRTSSAFAISEIFESLPNMVELMNKGLENFDLSKLTVLNDVMESMGGNSAAVTEMLQAKSK